MIVKEEEMKKHWLYFKYVIRHKWYVLLAGLKLGVPIWGLIIHDWQKFTPVEWSPYVWSFYGPWSYKDRPQHVKDAFDLAWLHHQHQGPHHWQYWLLREDSSVVTKVLQMPDRYHREMLADWIGASKAITGKDNTNEWYLENRHKISLHDNTRKWVEEELCLKPET